MTFYVGIDPGYATQGLVVIKDRHVVTSIAMKGDLPTTLPDKATPRQYVQRQRCFAILRYLSRYIPAMSLVAIEGWLRTGVPKRLDLSMETTYWRGWYDGFLNANLRFQPAYFTPAQIKKFLHPGGKAIDKGRKEALEYDVMLNTLDSILEPADLDRIKNPTVVKFDENLNFVPMKQWNDGKQHTLDAGSAAALLMAAHDIDMASGRCRTLPVTPTQCKIAVEVAELWQETEKISMTTPLN